MKIINNQDVLLIDEIKKTITPNSNIYISSNHFTAFALFELLPIFSQSKQVQILLNNNFGTEDDFRFIQNEAENKLNLLTNKNYGLIPVNADGSIDVNIKSSSTMDVNIEEVDRFAFRYCTVPVEIEK